MILVMLQLCEQGRCGQIRMMPRQTVTKSEADCVELVRRIIAERFAG